MAQDNYYIIRFYNASPEEIANYYSGKKIERFSDAILSEEIIAEINGDVRKSLNYWSNKKLITLIDWEKISRKEIDYAELRIFPESYEYLKIT